ncbi:hypothetical protein ACU4GA_32145 [Methylobacterium oryzae CBMB20]
MAREFRTGKAQAVTPEDFNERVKRLLANKPEPFKPEPKIRNFRTGRAPQEDFRAVIAGSRASPVPL